MIMMQIIIIMKVKLQNYMKQELEHQSKCSICWQVVGSRDMLVVDFAMGMHWAKGLNGFGKCHTFSVVLDLN